MEDSFAEFMEAMAPDADWAVTLVTASECAWSAELRLTQHPYQHRLPDQSIVFYRGGGATPEDVFSDVERAARQEVARWRIDATQSPLK